MQSEWSPSARRASHAYLARHAWFALFPFTFKVPESLEGIDAPEGMPPPCVAYKAGEARFSVIRDRTMPIRLPQYTVPHE